MWSNTSFVKEALCNIMKNVFCFYSNAINTLICCFQSLSHVWLFTIPVNCSMSVFPDLHCLLEFVQIHVHWVGDAITVSSAVAPFLFCLQSSPASGSFPMSQLFASGGRSIRASASSAFLPMNIQGWFPLGLTLLIPLQYKELSRVFSSIPKDGPKFN